MKVQVQSQAVMHLLREHRYLEGILGALESLLDGIENHAAMSRNDLALLIDGIGEFSYLRHEEKEESVLLPALERLGMDWEHGALPHVRREHRQERYLVRSLRQSAMQSDEWDEEDRRHFVAIGRELLSFTRRHLQNEETFLFPEANTRLSPELDQELVEQFEAIDRDLDGARNSQAIRERAAEALERLTGAEPSGTVRQETAAPPNTATRH